MSVRIERINSEIQKSLTLILRTKSEEHFGGTMVSVTRVDTTSDLKHCKVYVSIFADGEKEKTVFEGISKMSASLRRELASAMSSLRHMPELHFLLDDSLKYSQKINSILENIKK